MKTLTSKEIKKALFGIVLTDGSCIDKRFSIYSKNKELIDNIEFILSNISNLNKTHVRKIEDKRFSPPSIGWKLWTTNHAYFEKTNKVFYSDRKRVTKYIADRLDEISFAYVWMCDGFLEHPKNKKENKVQNIGWLCLESFPKEELVFIINRLGELGIESRLSPVAWGYGYRIKISGTALQKFIDMIYPFILSSFLYKTMLFYKSDNYISNDLLNTEHIIYKYNDVDDIVRHFQK